MPTITARISDELLEDLEQVETAEQTDRAETIRKLLVQSLKQWKTWKALEMLKEHKITYRKAAAFAGLTYVELLDLAARQGLDIGYTLVDLQKDTGR